MRREESHNYFYGFLTVNRELNSRVFVKLKSKSHDGNSRTEEEWDEVHTH